MTFTELKIQFDLNIRRKRSFLRAHAYKTDNGYFFFDSESNKQYLLDVNCLEKDILDVKEIGKGFEYSNISSFTVPSNVTKINDEAFVLCRRLESIAFGNRLAKIGDKAFYYCDGLSSIEFPKSLKHIGKFAFYSCTKLSNVIIPSRVKRICMRAFECCNLTSLSFENRTYSQVVSMKDYPWGIRDASIIKCSNDIKSS